MQSRDEVDDIVLAWQTERPDLDTEPLHIFSRLTRVAQLLEDQRRRVFSQHGLAAHEFDVLTALRRAALEQDMTPGQLIGLTHVTSGTMTNRLDRLAERRLINRRRDPQDGRQSFIRITPIGRRKVDAAFQALLAVEHELMATLPLRRQTDTATALRTLLHRLNES